MTNEIILFILVGVTLSTGLVAGVFLTFSDFVMRSLKGAAPAAGAEAMQVINREVYRSVFMVLLVGMVPVSIVVAIAAIILVDTAVAIWLITAGGIYVFGVMLVTLARNVPMNQRLEAMPQGGAEAQAYWPSYVRGWLVWNHVRTIASLAATAAYLYGAIQFAATI